MPPVAMQTGNTAPVLTTTGAPPVYTPIPAAPMAQYAPIGPVDNTVQPTSGQEKSTLQ